MGRLCGEASSFCRPTIFESADPKRNLVVSEDEAALERGVNTQTSSESSKEPGLRELKDGAASSTRSLE